jgi:predicted RNA-binding protein YlxR (DUF448 family)
MAPTRRRVTGPATADAPSRAAPHAAPAADDDADDAAERGPCRRCVVTRERLPRERMLRFVVGPDRVVVPDVAGRLPGRGIWLSARRDVLEVARAKGAFARAARAQVTVPPDLLPALVSALERRVADHIGLARRAGQAVSGFTKAREWLDGGRADLVVQATDGSEDECRRLLGGHAGRVPTLRALDAARLGALFGRDHAVHVALSAGRLAETVRVEGDRLAGLRGEWGGARDDERGGGPGADARRAGGGGRTNDAGPVTPRMMKRDQASS